MHTQPKYRVDIWIPARDERGDYVTMQSVTICTAEALLLFCGAIAMIAATSNRDLPQIAEISTIH